jgi:hypothetical protein
VHIHCYEVSIDVPLDMLDLLPAGCHIPIYGGGDRFVMLN